MVVAGLVGVGAVGGGAALKGDGVAHGLDAVPVVIRKGERRARGW